MQRLTMQKKNKKFYKICSKFISKTNKIVLQQQQSILFDKFSADIEKSMQNAIFISPMNYAIEMKLHSKVVISRFFSAIVFIILYLL